MRLSVDVGGTFTDLVVADGDGRLELHKTSTTNPDPIDGILAVLEIAASGRGRTLGEFLSAADTFIHGTTRAIAAIEGEIAGPLGLSIDAAALAIIDLSTEAMVNAIEEITVKQGIDPEDTVMIGGGGAAGLNGVAIARRLRCQTVVFPDAGAALSAAGAVMSELRAEAAHTEYMRTTQFDCERGNRILARLKQGAQAGSAANFADGKASRVDYAIEGRYPSQVWEIEVPLRGGTFAGAHDVRQLVKDFHARHLELFGFADDGD